MAQPVVVDLRNIYRPEDMAALGFIYESVGRPSRAAEVMQVLLSYPAQGVSSTPGLVISNASVYWITRLRG